MKLHLKTWALLGLAAVLLALNLVDRGTGERLAAQLPVLPAIDRELATKIELSSAIEKIILEREPPGDDVPQQLGAVGDWEITGPVQGDADQMLVRSLLSQFRKDVPIDVKVDEGNLEDYGLDATNGIVVELWEGEGEPKLSFTLGYDAPGGSSFIRLSGDDAIYRARVGGRHRYERRATDWRDAVLLGFETGELSTVEVTQAEGEGFVLVRGDSTELDENGLPVPGQWVLDPPADWPVDHLAVEAFLRTLGHMRAGDMLDDAFDGGFEPGIARVEFTLVDGSTKALVLGSRPADGGAYVKVDGREGVFRVALAAVRPLVAQREDLRNKTLFRLERDQVDTVALEEGQETILLQQDLSNGLWRVIQPPNVDLDVGAVIRSVRTLVELRAHDISDLSPAQAGTLRPKSRIVLNLLDGSTESLAIGAKATDDRGRTVYYVQREGDPQVWTLRDTTVAQLKQGFGRS